MFCNTKDSLSVEEKSVIYTITCTGGFQRYIGKTDRKLDLTNTIPKLTSQCTSI